MRFRRALAARLLERAAWLRILNTIVFWAAILLALSATAGQSNKIWSAKDVALIRSLSLDRQADADPPYSNRFANDKAAIALGKRLFFEPALSKNGLVSCASCHRPSQAFSDGLRHARGVKQTKKHTPGLIGLSHNTWFTADGRADSLWSQALLPIEDADEMGMTRLGVIQMLANSSDYKKAYLNLFGALPAALSLPLTPRQAGPAGTQSERNLWYRLSNRTRYEINRAFANVGKAIAAFERTLLPGKTRFDRYAASIDRGGVSSAPHTLSRLEKQGLSIFIDESKSHCLRCHNGPRFSNGDFHNISSGKLSGKNADVGRVAGAQAVVRSIFNCLGPHSDATPQQCPHLSYLRRNSHEQSGAFKTPSLRNLARTAPYFHDGRHSNLRQVIRHYVDLPKSAVSGGHELEALPLSENQQQALLAFLLTLTPYDRSSLVKQSPRP